MALSCTVFDTFDFEECHNLEIQVRGHSRSSKLVPFNSLPMVYYQHPITTMSKMHRLLKYSPLKSTVKLKPGLLITHGGLEITLSERVHTTAYSHSIVTLELACTISEIQLQTCNYNYV